MCESDDEGYRRLAVAMISDAVKKVRSVDGEARREAVLFLRSRGCGEIFSALDMDQGVVLRRLGL